MCTICTYVPICTYIKNKKGRRSCPTYTQAEECLNTEDLAIVPFLRSDIVILSFLVSKSHLDEMSK